MKTLLFVIAFLFTGIFTGLYAQEWKDSLEQARSLYKQGKYNEALKYYKSTERLAPKGVDLSEEKGQSAYRAAKYQEAEQAFQQATKQKDIKRKSSAYNNLGSARLKQKNFAGAQEAFKEALRLDPSNEKARQNLAEAKRIQKEEEKKKQQQQQQNQQNQDQQQNNGDSKGQPKPGDQQNQQGGQQKPQQGQGKPQPSNADPKNAAGQKLEDKQTDRKLDDLMRQEMDTKKRLDGSKSSTNGKPAKKDW